jgi:hypothetical protein
MHDDDYGHHHCHDDDHSHALERECGFGVLAFWQILKQFCGRHNCKLPEYSYTTISICMSTFVDF